MNPVVQFLITYAFTIIFTGIPCFLVGALVMFMRLRPTGTLQDAVEVVTQEESNAPNPGAVDPASAL